MNVSTDCWQEPMIRQNVIGKKEHMISEFYNFKHKLNESKERITALEKLLNKINFKNL